MAAQQQKLLTFLPALSPLSIAKMLWKRKVLIAVVWVAVSAAGYVVVSRIPSMFKAEAVVLVDAQKIPDRYVSSTVVSDAQDRLSAISQEIQSTGRLQKVIEDFDLYHAERKKHFIDDIVAMMRNDMEITPEKAWTGRTASFRITYQGPDPVVVARVANKMASLYVEENLKTREVQAEGTTNFIETQLKEAKEKLDTLEASVSQYKLKHNGELPQQEGSLNGILGRLGTQLEANRDALNRAQQQKALLQDSLGVAQDAEATQMRELARSRTASPAAVAPSTQPAPRNRSEDLEDQLADVKTRYSESHPDVKRLRRLIEEAKKAEAQQERARLAAETAAPKGNGPAAAKAEPPVDSPGLLQARDRIASIKSQLDVVSRELEARKSEQQRILGDISLYQARVNNMPIREQELAQLTRDYDISRQNYRSLLDKKIAAEMATDMERREKSERFTIVDPARVPARPFKPRRTLLDAGASVFGLVLGIVLAFGRELHAATLLGEWELPAGVAVLGRLPYIRMAPLKSRPGNRIPPQPLSGVGSL